MKSSNNKILTVSTIIISLAITMLSITNYLLQSKINSAEQEFYNMQLTKVATGINYDNNLLATEKIITNNNYIKYLGNKQQKIYLGKFNNEITAVIITTTAPDGYNGDINMLISIALNSKGNKIIKLEIIQHSETPGLGDLIESSKSKWLKNLFEKQSDLKVADTITGATISSQAVVNAGVRALELINNHPEIYL